MAASGNAGASSLESSGRRREQSTRRIGPSEPHGKGGDVGNNRQRLLEQKREILLEMKGVVSRQAEALERLGGSSATTVNRAAQTGGRGRGGGSDSTRRRSVPASYGGGSTKSSSVPTWEGTESCSRSSRAPSKAAGHQSTRRASCPDVSNLTVHSTPAGVRALAPPRPPENDTSAFLARGGRWGGEGRQGTSRRGRDSLASASSASYATYCNRSPGGGRAAPLRDVARPAAVPSLPLV